METAEPIHSVLLTIFMFPFDEHRCQQSWEGRWASELQVEEQAGAGQEGKQNGPSRQGQRHVMDGVLLSGSRGWRSVMWGCIQVGAVGREGHSGS